jgi:hypothetical protein
MINGYNLIVVTPGSVALTIHTLNGTRVLDPALYRRIIRGFGRWNGAMLVWKKWKKEGRDDERVRKMIERRERRERFKERLGGWGLGCGLVCFRAFDREEDED